MLFNSTESTTLKKIIEGRRSIKPHSFNGKTIDDKTVLEILSAANWAPNHGKTEPWRFKIFTGEGKIRLLDWMKKIYLKTTPPEKYNAMKVDAMEVNCQLSSHIIVIMMKRQEVEKIPEVEEIEAVACAVQNLALMATALNVAGYWSSGTITYLDETRRELGLSEKDRVLGFFYLGLCDEPVAEGKRASGIEEKISWVTE